MVLKSDVKDSHLTEVRRTITINKPAQQLYDVWKDPYQLGSMMGDTVQITPIGQNHSHWKIAGAMVPGLEWDAELIELSTGQRLCWQSEKGCKTQVLVMVQFLPAPGEQGTEAQLTFRFEPPGGIVGEALTNWFGMVPDLMVGKMLRRFKAYAETGEVPTLEFNPSNRKDADKPGEQK
jgi:uncharacterized membrane protein